VGQEKAEVGQEKAAAMRLFFWMSQDFPDRAISQGEVGQVFRDRFHCRGARGQVQADMGEVSAE
jgi:hypothetical protein